MKLFYDSEFTGLQQKTTFISLGMVDENGATFYAEFTDYASDQIDDWLRHNVLIHTLWLSQPVREQPVIETLGVNTRCCGESDFVRQHLEAWLAKYDQIEIWTDCGAYDWVLLCELFGGAFGIPKHIHYINRDIATLLLLNGLDIDANRVELVQDQLVEPIQKHNALFDAQVARFVYQKLLGRSTN